MGITRVAYSLLSEQIVNCFVLFGTINQKEKLLVVIVVYGDLDGNYTGKVALYYGMLPSKIKWVKEHGSRYYPNCCQRNDDCSWQNVD